MFTELSLTGRIVAASTRRPLAVVLLFLAIALGALFHTTRHFAMTTDTAELISTDLPWRQRELAFAAAFPQQRDLILAVIDGATPELADDAAARLAAALERRPDVFRTVRRPDSGPFFEREGLLLLPLAEVRSATEQLVNAQPFLGPLAADPSLRGVAGVIGTALEGVSRGDAALADLQPALSALAEAMEAAAVDQPAFFSWRALFAGAPPGPRETRRFILVQPVMDYGALQPGAAASNALRSAAAGLGLVPERGVTVRLTGPVPLADEEFATISENAGLVSGTMLLALLGILWLAVRSARVVLAIVAATFLGLVITAGLGLAATGRFNLISVAFIPLFVGLGIDFNIQLAVRALAERQHGRALPDALAAAGHGVGGALALAAAAIAAGLFAFLPTSYIGVAELGAIAGIGMAVAFVLSITLLPALLMILGTGPAGRLEGDAHMLAPLDRLVHRRRGAVLGTAAVAAVLSLVLLPFLRFDFDPLHLRSPSVESMATLADLMADPDRTPNTISALAPSLQAAADLARRLEALPEVSHTISLASFIPADQEEKLALVADAAMLLGPALEGVEPLPPPTDAELAEALGATAAALRRAAGEAQDPASASARRLAQAMGHLEGGPPANRQAAQEMLAAPLRTLLAQTRAVLQAAPVTRESLPADLVADWVTADGRARVQAFTAGDAQDDENLRRFAEAVQAVAPDATGTPISIRGAGGSIVEAFIQAGVLSFLAVTVLLALALRRVRDVALAMLPVLLSGLLTLATCTALDLPLNFANIIALPLLFGIGVAFNIYFVMAWRAGETDLLQSSLTRAVVFSALTTATAFGALWLSSHPGTASMGRLLMISLGWELLVTLLVRPALLAQPPAD